MAKKSIIVASVFGLFSTCYAAWTGDESAFVNASTQPMKLAAYEGFYKGQKNAEIVAFGILNSDKKPGDSLDPFNFSVKIPGLLGLMAKRDSEAFLPGIDDLVYGNEQEGIVGIAAKMEKGKEAIADLSGYKAAKQAGDSQAADAALARFTTNQEFLGYGYLESPEQAVPPVATTFYSFHIMVFLGVLFLVIFVLFLISAVKDTLPGKKGLLSLGFISFFLAMIASQAGWVVAEVGRQPWAIQGLMPVNVATTNISTGSVQATFFMFLAIFTLLLIAEIKIMMKQIKIGPEGV